jgi:hypothetical protein
VDNEHDYIYYLFDRMVLGFTTTYAMSAYQHYICEFEPHSWQGVFDTTLFDNVCQWLATGRLFILVLRTILHVHKATIYRHYSDTVQHK